jgi:hypothetical protein
MPTSRPFAYNTGSTLNNTQQFGNIAIFTGTTGLPSGVKWWNGPNEDLGYIIAQPVSGGTMTGADSTPAYLGFYGSSGYSDSSFLSWSNAATGQNFTGTTQAKTWFLNNGYWTTYVTNGLQLIVDAGNTLSYSGAGATWSDLSGNNRNSTLVNSPPYSPNFQGYLDFNGTDDYATFGNNLGLSGFPCTISFWVYLESGGRFFLGDLSNTTVNYLGVSFDVIANTNQISLSYTDGLGRGSTNRYSYQTNSYTSVNRWSNITIVMTTSITTPPTLYTNGTTLAFPYNSGTASSINWNAQYYINSLNRQFTAQYFKSRVSIIKTYNKALTADEVTQEYLLYKGRYGL